MCRGLPAARARVSSHPTPSERALMPPSVQISAARGAHRRRCATGPRRPIAAARGPSQGTRRGRWPADATGPTIAPSTGPARRTRWVQHLAQTRHKAQTRQAPHPVWRGAGHVRHMAQRLRPQVESLRSRLRGAWGSAKPYAEPMHASAAARHEHAIGGHLDNSGHRETSAASEERGGR